MLTAAPPLANFAHRYTILCYTTHHVWRKHSAPRKALCSGMANPPLPSAFWKCPRHALPTLLHRWLYGQLTHKAFIQQVHAHVAVLHDLLGRQGIEVRT